MWAQQLITAIKNRLCYCFAELHFVQGYEPELSVFASIESLRIWCLVKKRPTSLALLVCCECVSSFAKQQYCCCFSPFDASYVALTEA